MDARSSYLLDAAARGHYRQIKFFIDAGYNLDCVDDQGCTALIVAVSKLGESGIRNRVISLLLQGGANPNCADRHGLTPLMHSILRRQKDSVPVLLQSKRLDLGMEDAGGNSALMHAAALGFADVSVAIIEQLSAVHRIIYLGQKNRDGLTASDLAMASNYPDLAALLCWRASDFFSVAPFADPHLLDEHEMPFTALPSCSSATPPTSTPHSSMRMHSATSARQTRRSPSSKHSTGTSTKSTASSPACDTPNSSEGSLMNSPVVALQPGPLRRVSIQSSLVGIMPVVHATSPTSPAPSKAVKLKGRAYPV